MPIKNQINSFRHFGGEKWLCWGDFLVAAAVLEKARLRHGGINVRSLPFDPGMVRLFVPARQLLVAAGV